MLLILERSRTSIKIEEKIEKKKKKDRGYQLPKGQQGLGHSTEQNVWNQNVKRTHVEKGGMITKRLWCLHMSNFI